MASTSRRSVAMAASLCLAPLSGLADEVPSAPASQAPPASAPASPSTAPASSSSAEGDQRRLDIEAYDVEGNTVLQASDIEEAVYPFLGESKTPADVDK